MKNWMQRIISLFASIAFSLMSFSSFAHGFNIGEISIKHPYSTPSVPGSKNGVVYFKNIKNSGKEIDQLLSAKTQVADRVEIHEMKMAGDVMKMRTLSSIHIPAGAEVSFAKGNPNGYHLMLLGLKNPLKDGDKFPVLLTFKKAGEVEVEVWVQVPKDTNKAKEHQH